MTSESVAPGVEQAARRDGEPPLVSVVVPAARVDAYFFEALRSLLDQDYERLEIIVILDGLPLSVLPSPIGGPHVHVRGFETRRGTPSALNEGIQLARGKLIARLDADDLALPGRLRAQVEFLGRHPDVGCVGTEVLLIEQDGTPIPSAPPVGGGDVGPMLIHRNVLVHSSVMYRSAVVRELGGYSPQMQRMQDYDLFLRLARASKIAVLPERLTAYRLHGGQFSRLTSPWKAYTWNILRERQRLARHLGLSRITQSVRNVAWHGAQVLRYYNLRAPGYRTARARR